MILDLVINTLISIGMHGDKDQVIIFISV